MITIWFESHATTEANEAKTASGWDNAKLSKLGIQNAHELGERLKERNIDLVFCSDLGQAYKTGVIALGNDDPRKIFIDWRLRECDYGDFTHKPNAIIETERSKRITEPFPNGESYEQCMARIRSFLDDLKAKFDGKTVEVIGSRATHCGMEPLILGRPLKECLSEKVVWQPERRYELK